MKKVTILFFIAAVIIAGSRMLPAFADGPAEGRAISVYSGENAAVPEFVVKREYTDDSDTGKVKKEFLKQKADFKYEIKLINEAFDGEIVIAEYKLSSSIPAGKESLTISCDKYMKELKSKIKGKGRLEITISVQPGLSYSTREDRASIAAVSEEYIDKYKNDGGNTADLMTKFTQDYQNFIMQNPGKDQQTLNREFLKKYPQYKGVLPQ